MLVTVSFVQIGAPQTSLAYWDRAGTMDWVGLAKATVAEKGRVSICQRSLKVTGKTSSVTGSEKPWLRETVWKHWEAGGYVRVV
jgi:hypothetical protein